MKPLYPERQRRKVRWLCRHGHPLMAVGNRITCLHCTGEIIPAHRSGKPIAYCPNGHAYVVGTRCDLCRSWGHTEWLRKLDEVGEATCPKGHHITPQTVYRAPNQPTRRKCRDCHLKALETVQAFRKETGKGMPEVAHGKNGLCAAGKHDWSTHGHTTLRAASGRIERICRACYNEARSARRLRREVEAEQAREVDAHHVDWVVVLRILESGSLGDPKLYHMRRGQSTGPTAGEKWVAYCTWRTLTGREPNESGMLSETFYAIWRDVGLEKGFKFTTLWDLLTTMPDEEYLKGSVLLG